MSEVEARGATINDLISTLRIDIKSLAEKEEKAIGKIEKDSVAKLKITNQLIDKKTELFDQLEQFHSLYKQHLDGIDQAQKQRDEALIVRAHALDKRTAALDAREEELKKGDVKGKK